MWNQIHILEIQKVGLVCMLYQIIQVQYFWIPQIVNQMAYWSCTSLNLWYGLETTTQSTYIVCFNICPSFNIDDGTQVYTMQTVLVMFWLINTCVFVLWCLEIIRRFLFKSFSVIVTYINHFGHFLAIHS